MLSLKRLFLINLVSICGVISSGDSVLILGQLHFFPFCRSISKTSHVDSGTFDPSLMLPRQ